MKAVLLCAGFATRLYPLTRDRAKPLLEVRGKPVLDYLLEALVATGACDEIVVVANGRFAPDFDAWAKRHREHLGPVALRVLDDGARSNETRLGAVRDLQFAVTRMQLDDGLLVAAGDNLFRFPLGDLTDDFENGRRNLVVVHEEDDRERLRRTGVVELGDDGRILRFLEKPAEPPSNLSATPLYILTREALASLPDFVASHPDADAPGHFIAHLVAEQAVYAHRMRGRRLDLGSLETYRRAEQWLDEV